ncbi:MAG: 6-carboxytetrahydropterin synthase [Gammaproteobacteria bacterium]|nr:MAG: 6-carboxytetrahydropterin synthase [Gammaproteobacteria bacterium]
MYTLAVTRDFIANHYLIGGDWGPENNPHAHHYVAEISIEAQQLDRHGYLVDIVDVEAALDEIIGYFNNSTLNEKVEFTGLNPSIEHFSRILNEQLLGRIKPPGSGVFTVKLWENATCWAAFRQAFPVAG